MDVGRTSLDAVGIAVAAIRAWFADFGRVFVVSAAFTVPIFVLSASLVSAVDESRGSQTIDSEGTVLAGILTILLSGLLAANLVLVFVRIYREEDFGIGGVLAAAVDRLPAIVMFTAVAALLVGLGLIVLPVGLVLIVVLSIGLPALLVDELRGLEAVRVSFQLFVRHWLLILQVVALGLLINIGVAAVVGGLTGPGAGPFASPDFTDVDIGATIVQIGVSAALAPLLPALTTALYLEIRGRERGFPST